jgi:similar to stage IV sporulation protein
MVLWDIRIIGNVEVDAEKIKEDVRSCGLREGDLLLSVNTPELENLVLIESDHVAWISINIVGNVAEVEIREETEEPLEENIDYADLVADRDGVVELFEETRGNALVNIGDSVRKGDVLISGYYPADETVGERYTVAKGKVLARTEREFSVSVPLEYE